MVVHHSITSWHSVTALDKWCCVTKYDTMEFCFFTSLLTPDKRKFSVLLKPMGSSSGVLICCFALLDWHRQAYFVLQHFALLCTDDAIFLLKKLKTWVTHHRAYSRMYAHWVSVACLSSAHCMGWLSVLRICGQQSLMSLLKLSHSAINHVDKILQVWQTNVYLPGALYSLLSLGLPTFWNAMAFKQNQLTTQQWSLQVFSWNQKLKMLSLVRKSFQKLKKKLGMEQ